MEITGTIKLINETQTFGASGFKKREFVVVTEEQYPQPILMGFVQDKCELLNNYSIGQKVKVNINLRGREWINPEGEEKYFNEIQAWRIEAITPATEKPITAEPLEAFEPKDKLDSKPDDLPF